MNSFKPNSLKQTQTAMLVVALTGLAISGWLALQQLAQQGHAAFNTNNLGISWGLPIVVYDYFLLTSTGLAIFAAGAIVFGGESFRPVIKRAVWLALAGLAGGVAVLLLELGHPLRALWAIPFSFAFSSPLYWKVMFVSFYVLSLLILMFRMLKPDWTIARLRTQGIVTLGLALGVTAMAGMVYGAQSFRPFWASGDIPVAFIAESVLGGVAFVFFFSYLTHGFRSSELPEGTRRLFAGALPGLFALTIFVHLLFVLARLATGLYGNLEGLQVWQHIATSPLFHAEVLIGLVLPLALLLAPGLRTRPGVQILAAFLVMNALLISRYEYIIGGQLVPMFKGAWAPALLSYMPSFTEWLLLLVAVFLSNSLNAIGELTLGLDREGAPSPVSASEPESAPEPLPTATWTEPATS